MGIASRAVFALCAALGALGAERAPAVDLVGPDAARLEWVPASGDVAAYAVFVSRNGGPYRSEQYTREPRARLGGRPGETLQVRVRAYGFSGGRTLTSEASDPSDPIRFLPSETPPPRVASAPPAAAVALAENVRPIPGFQVAPTISVQTQGDFDGDGDLDVLATLGSWRHPIALFLEDESLEHAACLAPLGEALSALAADFDGDSRDEVALQTPGQLILLHLERDGGLTPIRREAISASARLIAADLDGDSAASLVVYEPATGRLSERLPSGDGIDFGSIWPLHALHAGDFDGDGRDDLFIQAAPGPDAQLWLMSDGGDFAVMPVSLGRTVSTATIADVNGDGYADLAGYDAARGELHAWLLDGGRVIGERRLGASGPVDKLQGGDVDNDGVDDLLLRAPDGEARALLLSN